MKKPSKHNTTKFKKQYPGFTFIELIMAIVMMGVLLTLTTSVVVSTIRFYAFSNTIRQNQQNGRNILDTITRDVRFGQLIVPADSSATDSICIYKANERKLEKYKLESFVSAIYKYSKPWSTNEVPRVLDCNPPEPIPLDYWPDKVQLNNPINMGFKELVVQRIKGAELVSNANSASVTIKMVFFTGKPDPETGECDVRDIYCTKLEYNTAINLSSGG